jgi:hypothetical protein
VRISDTDFEVVGVFAKYDSLFGAIAENFAVIPYTTYEKRFADRDESIQINCLPASTRSLEEASRRRRPSCGRGTTCSPRCRTILDPDFRRGDGVREQDHRPGGARARDHLVDRTDGRRDRRPDHHARLRHRADIRRSGLRKAVGASRREILWQFLLEAATLTLDRRRLGIGAGLGLAKARRT